jgi:hypothetical protein
MMKPWKQQDDGDGLFFVNRFGVKRFFLNKIEGVNVADGTIKASVKADVASWAMGLATQQDHILIAIDAGFDDFLNVAGFFAFDPDFLAAARVKGGLPGRQRLVQSLAVHPPHHQHLTGLNILDNGGDQPLGVEPDVE